MTPARKLRIWDVSTFARHAYGDESPAACVRARRFLKKLDAKHGGALLIPSDGTANRCFRFYAARLFALEPDVFAPVENLEARIDAAEEFLEEMKTNERMIVDVVREHSRAVARMRGRAR